MTLAGDRPYKLDVVDPWEMTVTPVGTAPAGEFSVSAPKADMAFRFTPYQPGEKLRPEAKITASVTEGVAPLEVRFGSSGDGKTQWDFGDGAVSDEPNPTHVFEKPGLYSVTLTVTDADRRQRPLVRANRRGPEDRATRSCVPASPRARRRR